MSRQLLTDIGIQTDKMDAEKTSHMNSDDSASETAASESRTKPNDTSIEQHQQDPVHSKRIRTHPFVKLYLYFKSLQMGSALLLTGVLIVILFADALIQSTAALTPDSKGSQVAARWILFAIVTFICVVIALIVWAISESCLCCHSHKSQDHDPIEKITVDMTTSTDVDTHTESIKDTRTTKSENESTTSSTSSSSSEPSTTATIVVNQKKWYHCCSGQCCRCCRRNRQSLDLDQVTIQTQEKVPLLSTKSMESTSPPPKEKTPDEYIMIKVRNSDVHKRTQKLEEPPSSESTPLKTITTTPKSVVLQTSEPKSGVPQRSIQFQPKPSSVVSSSSQKSTSLNGTKKTESIANKRLYVYRI